MTTKTSTLLLLFLLTPLLAARAGDNTVSVIQRAMQVADQDKNGELSLEEFKPLDVQARHHGEEHFEQGDVNHDGFLDTKELATTLAKKQTWFVILVEGIETCFQRIDTDKDSKLDATEYRKISRMGGHAEHHHRSADLNEDGFLDLQEFTTHANAKLEPATVKRKKNKDLVTPIMTEDQPVAGKRARQTAPEYQGTEVYHSLYLPVDWKPGGKYPVIVEYTGNKFPPGKGSGEVKDANLGYGMSGGRQFIWIVMPYVEKDHKQNAVTWWGDKQATVDYCKVNLPRICQQFGGDLNKVFICGFSRGAIGSSYIGLADDEIAALWKGMFTHDHFDGQKKWGYAESDRESALVRLARLNGRPVLICGQHGTTVRDQFLKDHLDLAQFTFLDVPTTKIFNIPEGQFIHPHNDLWMHRESKYRQLAREWLEDVVKQK